MISRERAVELVEAQLAKEQPTWASASRCELAVVSVKKHEFGWAVFWNSAEYARTRDRHHMLIGSGPYLVDGLDGSIHHIPTTTWMSRDWEELYLRQVRGDRSRDPVAREIRALVESDGAVAAMHHLRRRAPRLSPEQAQAYVAAVRGGGEPSEELAELTRAEELFRRPVIETLAGPVQ
ncbi:YrhB domain-containing protein [Streptomyces sp. NRRL WC-3742]|uniref:YrhB domain-containing protein n=1 Tax=Streptomyces sp. NRRL WC-3742 TaxID=1463934 RepID=UPI0004C905AA|nr:YrhB domain-containing protein [Streptomyces sp. NRRL WC-3742]